MKLQRPITVLSAVILATTSALPQGVFQDLDFESANLPVVAAGQSGGLVPINSALPGWSASIGGVFDTEVYQNNSTLGQANITVLSPDWTAGPGIIDGNYSVYLQSGGTPGDSSVPADVSLWQDGTIPQNAKTLEFGAWEYLPSTAVLDVSFSGNTLSPVLLSSDISSSGQPYNVYGLNVASFAGQTGRLEFTSVFNSAGPSWTELDDISFLPTSVTPEPDPLVLMCIGGALFAAYRRFAPKRQ